MLRTVYLAILPGMALFACTAWVFADTTRPANRVAVENKLVYSNRPAGYVTPVPYYGTPMAPRYFVPPAVQYRPAVVFSAVEETADEAKSFTVTHDLSAPQVAETIFILREPQPEVNVNDELDSFYARLAKIHVEKQQLSDALVLIKKIKSETFKVRTVVSLAEYVSRDSNYRDTADKLFSLALAGMEALDRGQPFNVELGGVKASVALPPGSGIVAPAPAVTQPDLEDTPPPPAQPAAAPGLETRPAPIPLDDTEPPAAPPSVKPGVAPRPQLLLEEDAGRSNGKLPPPPPPRGNGVDGGIVLSPPGQPPISSTVAPPARTTEDIGLTPPSPPNSATSPPNSATETTTQPPTRVRPAPIPLEDAEQETPVSPSEEKKTEGQPQQPPTRRPSRIILDEN